MQVVPHHVVLDLGQSHGCRKTREGVAFELGFRSRVDAQVHHALERNQDDILLKAGDGGLLELAFIILLAEKLADLGIL